MAKGNSLFSFVLGLAAGAGLTILAITGKGEELVKKAVDEVKKAADDFDKDLEKAAQEAEEAEEQQTEE